MIKSLNKLKLRLVDILRKTDALKLYEEFSETQWLTKKEISQIRWQRLKDLLNHAYVNVFYYRKLFDTNGIKPNDIRSIEDFRKIPILTKDIIRANQDDMLSKNKGVFQPLKKASGGSTGHPLIYYMDRRSWSAKWAIVYRLWNNEGWTPGDRVVLLAGTSLYPSIHGIKKWFYVKLNNWLILSAFNMSEINMKIWVDKIRRFDAKFMHGYPSSIYLFAKFLEDIDIKDISFQAVFTTAEPLMPKYRDTIERVFSCEVFDLYGANDGGGFSFECKEHNGLHCASESCMIEVIKEDGSVAGDGEPGEIVSTDLFNYAMPFIRYKVGDIGTVDSKPCKCGRGLLLLKEIKGRSHDFLTTKDGQKVHGEFFGHLFRGIACIRQFYVVQESECELSIYIKPNIVPSANELRWIENVVQRKFDGMDINIHLTESTPVTASGKFKYIVNKTLT